MKIESQRANVHPLTATDCVPLQVPMISLLTLTVPVVDYERELDGWNRYLNVLQCAFSPSIALLLARHDGM